MRYYGKKLLVALLVIANNFTFSQSKYMNGVFLELAGVGGPYSINYERQFHTNLVGRVGFSYLGSDFLIPVSLSKIFGEKRHHFEIGLGLTFNRYKITIGSRTILITGGNQQQVIQQKLDVYWYNSLYLTSFIGYRFQKPDKKFFYRCGFTPLWRFYNTDPESNKLYQFIPWGGLSVGYRF